MNREKARAISADLDLALRAVAVKHGLRVVPKGVRFGENMYRTTVELLEGSEVQQGKADWDRYCVIYGLKPEDFGSKVKFHDNWFEIVGIEPNRPKYPISVKRLPDGKRFKWTEQIVHATRSTSRAGGA